MSTEAKAVPKDNEGKSVPAKKKGIARLIAAAGYSVAGLRSAFASEEAFRLEVFALLLAIPLAFYFGQSPMEQVLLIGSVMLVMMVELLNTAVEAVVDSCLLYTSPSPRDVEESRMPSSA